MMPPNKILVPVDFSEASYRVLDYAIDLARRLGAEVVVMHAFEIPVVGFPDGAMIVTADIMGRIMSDAQAALKAAVEPRENKGVVLHTLLKQEEPWQAILGAAEETHANLIVMSTHGRRGLPRALLGSVAEKVVRTAPCAVLTIRGQELKDGRTPS